MIKKTSRYVGFLLLVLFASASSAQNWPEKAIRFVNPFAPGGFGDGVARPMFEQLGLALGQPIIVESQAGANGSLASNVVAKAAPDGYTLLIGNMGPMAINPTLYPETTADPLKVFSPIMQLVSGPLVLLVHPDFPAKTLSELIDYARANPGKLTYGSVGAGSTTHFAGELLRMQSHIDILQVPFRGAAPALINLLGRQIDMAFVNISLAKPHIESGKLRPLAVTTLSRSSILPDVPAVAELLPGFEVNPWWGLLAPINTPAPIVDRIQSELARILKDPAITDRLRQNGLEPEATTPKEFSARIASDIEKWREVARVNNITGG
ncbi:MAG: tripartite tricarboxylate transporter substrate binding protein [Burkholderiaceae bacterium]|nr:tripartite tricarboxylate transporter substrate binding protein [Burkholderiaceae bacterium]